MAMHKLPEEVKKKILLKVLDGECKKQIARDLGLSRVTVHKILRESRLEQRMNEVAREKLQDAVKVGEPLFPEPPREPNPLAPRETEGTVRISWPTGKPGRIWGRRRRWILQRNAGA